jgi:hypothetical protein
MMTRAFVLSIVLVSYTYADQFQLKGQRNDQTYLLEFVPVTVKQGDRVVFQGRTDGLGRIAIPVGTGTSAMYTLQAQDYKGSGSVTITLDNAPAIKVVAVPIQ